MICYNCNKEVEDYSFDKESKIVCKNCIRTLYSDPPILFCAGCGKWLGPVSNLGKEQTELIFYVNISSMYGKGIGTLTMCDKCIHDIPDRMHYYTRKLNECKMKGSMSDENFY